MRWGLSRGMGLRLAPDRPAEIDRVLIGERTGAGADGTADQRAFERCSEHQPAERTDAGADSRPAEGAVSRAVAARREGEDGNQQAGSDCYAFHGHLLMS